jgi:membrane protein implicated in regulation of membrane protease activity
MIDVSNLWPDIVEWIRRTPETVRALDPIILALLAIPLVLALAARNGTALLLTLLLAGIAVSVLGFVTSEPARWVAAVLICAAGLLAVLLAVQLRRGRGQLHHVESVLEETRRELAEVREKYEGEVYWRRASERVSAQSPG